MKISAFHQYTIDLLFLTLFFQNLLTLIKR